MANSRTNNARWYACKLHSTRDVGERQFRVDGLVYVKCLNDGSTNVVFNGRDAYKMLTKTMCRETMHVVSRLCDDEHATIERLYDVVRQGL